MTSVHVSDHLSVTEIHFIIWHCLALFAFFPLAVKRKCRKQMYGQSSAGAGIIPIFHTMRMMYCAWLFTSMNIKPNNNSGNLSGKEIMYM